MDGITKCCGEFTSGGMYIASNCPWNDTYSEGSNWFP